MATEHHDIHPAFATYRERLVPLLANGPPPDADVLQAGRHTVIRVPLAPGLDVAWKQFGRESALKNRADQHRGTKAKRSFETAARLLAHGVGTPAPVAWHETWDGNRLLASHYLSVFVPELTSFRDEMIRLWDEQPPLCSRFMDLLQAVAPAVRALHDAGVAHHDLGNQNILLRATEDSWDNIQFIDLNRAQLHDTLSPAQRGRDLCRIDLPSELRRVFFEMIFAPETIPDGFRQAERRARDRFDFHTNSRRWRHPIRTRRNPPQPTGIPPEKDMWIWDDRSLQAIPALRSRDRRKHHPFGSHLHVASVSARRLLSHRKEAHALGLPNSLAPIPCAGRIGLMEEAGRVPDLITRETPGLPLHLRFYHHESPADWERGLTQLHALRDAGHPISLALVQDRRAITHPAAWATFVNTIIDGAGPVPFIEVGHAINRVKWGLWTVEDIRRLLAPLRSRGLPLVGPAIIDFEMHLLLAALDVIPEDIDYHALSHHLYIDRRGAPENSQQGADFIDKINWLRVAARRSPRCADRVILTEANWPILGTGVWSPVNSPYASPGVRFNDPSVHEGAYRDYMLRYLLLSACTGLADQVFWWKCAAKGFGLCDESDNGTPIPRLAWHAFAALVRLLADATCIGTAGIRTPDTHHLHFQSPSRGRFTIAYRPESTDAEATKPAPAGATTLTGEPVDTIGSTPHILPDFQPTPAP